MDDAVELPCTVCKSAAVRINLSEARDLIPGKWMLALRGGARLAGNTFDANSPTFGFSPAEISELLGVTCIPCVDAVDNNTPTTHQEAV